MLPSLGGLAPELRSRSQYVYPTENYTDYSYQIRPLGRVMPQSNPIFQGSQLACVPCSITFCANYVSLGATHDWKEMWGSLDVRGQGVKPSQALEWGRLQGWYGSYYEIPKRDRYSLYSALKFSPIMIGLPVHELFWAGTAKQKPLAFDGQKDYGHMCVLFDVTEEGDWIVANWADSTKQDSRVISKDYPIDVAYAIEYEAFTGETKPVSSFASLVQENARRLVKFLV